MLDVVSEGISWLVTLTFTDSAGDGVTPSAANYRIDDKESGDAILASTPFSPSSSSHTLTITPAQNAMVDATKSFELHVLTADFTYGGGKTGQAVYTFAVKNLTFVT